jgi:hypothetical protein
MNLQASRGNPRPLLISKETSMFKERRSPRLRNKPRELLRRLSPAFCWRLLDALLKACSQELSTELYETLRASFRRRSTEEYYGLDAQYGLQCIAGWVNPTRGNPAVIHMLVSAFRKCENLELFSAKERKARCLAQVRLVDDALPDLKGEWETDEVYSHARKWLAGLLQDCPSLDAVHYCSRHGPGSTASLDFGSRSQYYKYYSVPYRCTPQARSLLVDCLKTDARWSAAVEDLVRRECNVPVWSILDQAAYYNYIVDGRYPFNVVTTVPKDGRKDRPIAKEQTGNIYLQLGVGAIIRARLRGFGVDLNKQSDVNRSVALESSRTREFFTIDLSNASDTVSYALVRSLLPAKWFELLDSLRAPWGVLPTGEAFLYRKFSSMGNGFTFELESVLFLALCYGVRRVYGCKADRVFAYGDDIIGPDYLYAHCCAYLTYSGFQVNSEKSFHGSARVRESCGVDALDGRNIRPFFVKRTPQGAMEAIGLRNRIRAWFYRQLGDYPVSFDNFLLEEMFERLPPVGPDSDVEFDGWLQDGPWTVGTSHDSYTSTTDQLPARELHIRKLMHDLRSCSGEGGNFLVSEVSQRVRLVGRVVGRQFDWLLDS